MASFNKVILMGNLTRDPELKTTPSGSKVANFGLAMSETWKDRTTGENREITCFVDVEVWERSAELCGQYLRKGSPVLVEGRLRMDEWTNQQGEKRSRLRVRADNIRFVGSRRESQGEGQSAPAAFAPPPQNSPVPPPPQTPAPGYNDPSAGDDDDLPF